MLKLVGHCLPHQQQQSQNSRLGSRAGQQGECLPLGGGKSSWSHSCHTGSIYVLEGLIIVSSPVAQSYIPLSMWETQVQSLGWEDPLEKGMETHSSILAWEIPWTEEPGRVQSMGSKRVGHDWVIYLDFRFFLDPAISSKWGREPSIHTTC